MRRSNERGGGGHAAPPRATRETTWVEQLSLGIDRPGLPREAVASIHIQFAISRVRTNAEAGARPQELARDRVGVGLARGRQHPLLVLHAGA